MLQARCLAVGQTLLGYYEIPATIDRPLSLVVNPRGQPERAKKLVWNAGDNRRKLITIADKTQRLRRGGQLPAGGGVSRGATWADASGKIVTPVEMSEGEHGTFRESHYPRNICKGSTCFNQKRAPTLKRQ